MARRSGQEHPSLPPGWRRRDEQPETPPEKPVEAMSDAELSEAIAKTKRELLEIQRKEVRQHQEGAADEPGGRAYFSLPPKRPRWRG